MSDRKRKQDCNGEKTNGEKKTRMEPIDLSQLPESEDEEMNDCEELSASDEESSSSSESEDLPLLENVKEEEEEESSSSSSEEESSSLEEDEGGEDARTSSSDENKEEEGEIKRSRTHDSDSEDKEDISSEDDDPKGKKSAKNRRWQPLRGRVQTLLRMYHPNILLSASENRDADKKAQKETKKGYKMVTYEVEGETFTITRDKIEEAFSAQSLIRHKMEEKSMVIEKGNRKNSIRVIDPLIKPFYMHLALEWARLPQKWRCADAFIAAALVNCHYVTDAELCHVKEFSMSVNDKERIVTLRTPFLRLLYEFRLAMDYLGVQALVDEADSVLMHFHVLAFGHDERHITLEEYQDPSGNLPSDEADTVSPKYLVAKSSRKMSLKPVPDIWKHEYKTWIEKEFGTRAEVDSHHSGNYFAVGIDPVWVWSAPIPPALSNLHWNEKNIDLLVFDHEELLKRMEKAPHTCPGYWQSIRDIFFESDRGKIEAHMTKYDISEDNVLAVTSIAREYSADKAFAGKIAKVLAHHLEFQEYITILSRMLFMDMNGVFSLFRGYNHISPLNELCRAIGRCIAKGVTLATGSNPRPAMRFVKEWIGRKVTSQPYPNPVDHQWFNCKPRFTHAGGGPLTSNRMGVQIPWTSGDSIMPCDWMKRWESAIKKVDEMDAIQKNYDRVKGELESFYRS